jgi:hypothetical protein
MVDLVLKEMHQEPVTPLVLYVRIAIYLIGMRIL